MLLYELAGTQGNFFCITVDRGEGTSTDKVLRESDDRFPVSITGQQDVLYGLTVIYVAVRQGEQYIRMMKGMFYLFGNVVFASDTNDIHFNAMLVGALLQLIAFYGPFLAVQDAYGFPLLVELSYKPDLSTIRLGHIQDRIIPVSVFIQFVFVRIGRYKYFLNFRGVRVGALDAFMADADD